MLKKEYTGFAVMEEPFKRLEHKNGYFVNNAASKNADELAVECLTYMMQEGYTPSTTSQGEVKSLFKRVKKGLDQTEDIPTYFGSHQVGHRTFTAFSLSKNYIIVETAYYYFTINKD